MKMIFKDYCYIQVADILYLLRNDSGSLSEELYKHILNQKNINKENDYVKITDPKLIKYISNKNCILDYGFLSSKKVDELNELLDELTREMQKRNVVYPRSKAVVNAASEKENIKYYISQIKEMILTKTPVHSILHPLDQIKLKKI